MELKEQLTSLAPSERLKELGVKQESEYYHQWNCVVGKYFLRTKKEVNHSMYPYEKYVSAFSVAENDDALPWKVNYEGNDIFLRIRKGKFDIWYYEYHDEYDFNIVSYDDLKQSDASALLRCWLIENKLIEV